MKSDIIPAQAELCKERKDLVSRKLQQIPVLYLGIFKAIYYNNTCMILKICVAIRIIRKKETPKG